MKKLAIYLLFGTLFGILLVNSFFMLTAASEQPFVTVISGPHVGRSGKIVSTPWIGNLWGARPTVNVDATEDEVKAMYGDYPRLLRERLWEIHNGGRPRAWLTVWYSDCCIAAREPERE